MLFAPWGSKEKAVRRTTANILKYKCYWCHHLVTPCFAKDVQQEDQCAVQADFLPPLDLQCSFSRESFCNNSPFPQEQPATSGHSALLCEPPKFRRLD
ncbi:hypothetical protein SLEP1_g5870 [Rubroshorea leprosula]|uniref:Uncharacterized protein n=1 Tax=Rubroshorea leprosula TaxID=152421 RepID=A0AAV5HXQ1_9ROSI|nr:hypothetical protein SLEP1_g5870 [Rubroshorea leprosula]